MYQLHISFRSIRLLLFCFFLFLSARTHCVYGQAFNADSARVARQRVIDSTRSAQKHILDSTRAARQHYVDSLKSARKEIADSLAALRKYRESKHYKDSVANVRKKRVDSIRAVRKAFNDSVRTERQRVIDSANAVRKQEAAERKAIQQQRADSLGSIRKYRQSKRYKDSVAVTRQHRTDSIRLVRKRYTDSLVAARKKILEEAAEVRKKHNDSLIAARKKITDSLVAIRKVRTDSLAKVREAREKLRKSQEKLNKDKAELALELKIKKKRQAWNNEKMLKKKWSLPRKVLQNTVTRYNYYFNADRKMDEALDNMLRLRKEDYDSMIALFPFDPDVDSTKLAPDMDSIIQKTSLGIQIHDPRTKWADDLYLLMGQAYYYKGNYEQASIAFRYIISINQQRKIKEMSARGRTVKKGEEPDLSVVQKDEKGTLDFLKHKPANNDAILWLARTYTEAHKESDAESVLDLLQGDKNMPDYLKGRLALEKAYLNLSRGNYRAVTPELTIVADDEELPHWLRLRAAYLNGQLLYEQGSYAAATEHFQKVIDLKPKIEMDFYARKNMAYAKMENGGDEEDALAELKRILKDGKYATYYEQVYYIMGRLAANNRKYDDAITYLEKSISGSKSTKKQKALSYASLGNVYYIKGDYQTAGLAYDSAAYLARYAPDDSIVQLAIKRAKVLDNIARPTQMIRKQDSLLTLAGKSERDQKSAVRKYIRMLEQQRSDSIAKAENGDIPKVEPEQQQTVSGSGYANWYFSNPVLMQQGLNDFKRKWGNRSNVDNWRRSGAVGGTTVSSGAGTDETQEDSEDLDENGLPTEQSLLAAIPASPEQKALANQRIQKAYIELANAYIKDLSDYPNGEQTLDTLDARYPDHEHKAQALYLRYQIALHKNQLDKAQSISEQIRRDYGNTQWAQQLAPIDENRDLLASNAPPVSTYYDETYGMMMQRDYTTVLQRAQQGQKMYNDPVYLNRFRIMEAIALVGTGSYGKADTLLTDFISKHPSDSLRFWAEMVMNYAKKATSNAPAPNDSTGTTGSMVPLPPNAPPAQIPGGADSTASANAGNPPPAVYKFDPKAEHYFLFYFYKAESKSQGVKVGLKDFNTFNYSSQHLATDMDMLQEQQGIIFVKSFPTAAHAKIYMNAVKGNNLLLKEYNASEYQLMVISADNFRKLTADRDIQPYLKFYKTYYK